MRLSTALGQAFLPLIPAALLACAPPLPPRTDAPPAQATSAPTLAPAAGAGEPLSTCADVVFTLLLAGLAGPAAKAGTTAN